MVSGSITATSATLHSIGIVSDARVTIPGNITKAQNDLLQRAEGGGFTLLPAVFNEGEWGSRPTLIADFSIEYPSKIVRERVSIPLRARHTSDLAIP
jgi:hypothetical protein